MARTRWTRNEHGNGSGGGGENSATESERWTRERTRSGRLVRVVEKEKSTDKAVKIEDSTGEEKEESGDNASVFECNICFELAKEPVVTCCGHLFCWPCLYQWLNIHCLYKECPICKGKVEESNIVPIYGRGSSETSVDKHKKNKKNKNKEGHQPPKDAIPPRPTGNRVESLRQHFQGPLFRHSQGWFELGRPEAWFEELFQRELPVPARDTFLSSPPLVHASSVVHRQLDFHQEANAEPPPPPPPLPRTLTSRWSQRGEFRYLDPARRRERDPHPSQSQASTSSTMAVIQGDADLGASRSPQRGGSSTMVLRRVRSRPSDSQDGNGPARNRRRAN